MPAKHTGIRTFELIADVTHPLAGKLDDWPAKIQDPIFAALERISMREQIPIVILDSRCGEDIDVPEDAPGRYFVHVVASEIVIADERTLPPGTVVRP